MGRLNVSYISYIIKRRLLRFLPYKIRKPILLVMAILGLYAYFRFMISMSIRFFGSPSKYLIGIQSVINLIISNFQNVIGTQGTAALFVLIAGLLIYKYSVPVIKKEVLNTEERKEYHAKSYYYQINSLISVSYLLVTILTFLPFFIK